MPTGNENSNGRFFYFNEKTGKWTPLASVESISFDVTLSEEGEANLASIFEPLGDLEIVPNPKKPGENGGDGNDS